MKLVEPRGTGDVREDYGSAIDEASGGNWPRKRVFYRSMRSARAHATLLALVSPFFGRVLLRHAGGQKQHHTKALCCDCAKEVSGLAEKRGWHHAELGRSIQLASSHSVGDEV